MVNLMRYFPILAFVIMASFSLYFISCNLAGDIETTFNVTFEVNGGDTGIGQQTVNNGGKVTRPTNPIRTGYTFGGWYKEETYINQWNFSSDTVTENITLYAKWIINNYKIIYNANGGVGSMSDSNLTYGIEQNLRFNIFTRTNYIFAGWARVETGFVEFTDGASVSNLAVTQDATVILYAQWSAIYHIEYNANGGTGVMAQTTHTFGVQQNLRANTFVMANNNFVGWSRSMSGLVEFEDTVDGSNFTVAGGATVTLYAVWQSYIVPGSTFSAKLSWLQTNVAINGNYIIEVSANETIIPQRLSYNGKSGITITLRGIGATRIISLSTNGSLFSITEGVTLVLDNNITLQGLSRNIAGNTHGISSLVSVYGGSLIMNSGATITGNEVFNGVLLSYGTHMTIDSRGGGVYLENGIFTMNGGTISNNSVTANNPQAIVGADGGGIYVNKGTFNMYGGIISGNNATSITSGQYDQSRSYGAGICIWEGTFNMYGGTISNNTNSATGIWQTSAWGAGVCVVYGIFNKTGGTIYGNSGTERNVNYRNGLIFNDGGHAATGGSKRRETTAGTSVNLYFSNGAFSGGWEF